MSGMADINDEGISDEVRLAVESLVLGESTIRKNVYRLSHVPPHPDREPDIEGTLFEVATVAVKDLIEQGRERMLPKSLDPWVLDVRKGRGISRRTKPEVTEKRVQTVGAALWGDKVKHTHIARQSGIPDNAVTDFATIAEAVSVSSLRAVDEDRAFQFVMRVVSGNSGYEAAEILRRNNIDVTALDPDRVSLRDAIVVAGATWWVMHHSKDSAQSVRDVYNIAFEIKKLRERVGELEKKRDYAIARASLGFGHGQSFLSDESNMSRQRVFQIKEEFKSEEKTFSSGRAVSDGEVAELSDFETRHEAIDRGDGTVGGGTKAG